MLRGKSSFAVALATSFVVPHVQAADHLDAPALRAAGQGGRDVNDLYAFDSPEAGNDDTVLIMTVNPFAGVMNPFGTTSDRSFDSTVEYQFQIDNNNDQVADVTYATTFSAPVAGVQTFTTTRNGALYATGVNGTSVSATGGDGRMQVGLFEDPFFFDLVGFNAVVDGTGTFTGDDTFAGADVSAIVLEVPDSELNGADSNVAVWARTVVDGNQVDRMGRPAINTALIPSARKDEFNLADPANDSANFGADVRTAISGFGGDPNLADTLLPDVLTLDTSNEAGFLNGRRVEDDVIDAELNLLTGGAVTEDGVDSNDAAFPGVFPYLAAPNAIPEPSAVALLAFGLSAVGYCSRRRGRP